MRFTAVITKEGKWYIAHCVELGVVSQGRTIEEAQANLKEAVELYIESFGREDLPQRLRVRSLVLNPSFAKCQNKFVNHDEQIL